MNNRKMLNALKAVKPNKEKYIKQKITSIVTVSVLMSVCLCSCSSVLSGLISDDFSVHKPNHLVYRSDIVISKNYDTVTVNDTEYIPNWKSNSEICIPSDVKIYGAVAEGEKAEDKEKSNEVDIVYISEICSDYIWLISSKEIDNDSVIIIPGQAEMYEKKEKIEKQG